MGRRKIRVMGWWRNVDKDRTDSSSFGEKILSPSPRSFVVTTSKSGGGNDSFFCDGGGLFLLDLSCTDEEDTQEGGGNTSVG